MVRLPLLIPDASPTFTREYDLTLRAPALPIYHRWPILAGFENGAPVDDIATGISIGERWTVGPAPLAQRDAIWLLPLEVSYAEQIAAWRAIVPPARDTFL